MDFGGSLGMETQVLAEQVAALNSSIIQLQDKMVVAERNAAHLWRLTAAIFVFLMQLGFSLLEAGTVRFKNTRNIMLKNVLDTCVCAIAFWMFGYAIAFGEGTLFFGWRYPDPTGNKDVAFFGSMNQVNGVDFFFQFTFAATSTTIIAGAVAERTHLWAYLFYNFFSSTLIYPVIAHIVWSKNGFLSASRGAEIIHTNGVLDNAGSMVVHVTGGVTSLVGAWMVGPRIGRYDIDGHLVPFKSHSVVYMAAGTLVLWVGFYGFNAGSVDFLSQDPSTWVYAVARVAVNTTLSAAFAGFTTFAFTYHQKEPKPEDTFNAVIGGLVAACATSSIVQPYASVIIGIGAGLSYQIGVWVMLKLKIDDVVMACPTHLFCGSWGAIAVGLFATPWGIRHTYSIDEPKGYGLFHGGGGYQLLVQILGLLVVYFWTGTTTYILFYILGFFGLLRVKRQEEEVGLDVAFHGGDDADNMQDVEGGGGRKYMSRAIRRRLGAVHRMVGLGMFGRRGTCQKAGESYHLAAKKDVWYKAIEATPFGHFSLAMYEANYVMEDAGEVEASSSGVYIGVHDGHGGTETAEYLKEHLYQKLKGQFVFRGGGVSVDSIKAAFAEADYEFTEIVRDAFDGAPHLATVGACSVACIITANAIWVANVGDCRAVLGQVRRTAEGEKECRALQLSVDHNLKNPVIREKFIMEHANMPDAVTDKKGSYRVKGKVQVTRAFGDLYLKAREFNREPLFARFRVPEPFIPPLLTAEPSISVRLLAPHDSFVIVASDGLYEFLSNQEAVDIVASNPKKDVARKLVRAALQRAAERHEVTYQELLRMPSGQRREYHDDMAVVVFYFDHDETHKANRNNKWDGEMALDGSKDAKEKLSRRLEAMNDVELISTHHGGNLIGQLLQTGSPITEAEVARSSVSSPLVRTSSTVVFLA